MTLIEPTESLRAVSSVTTSAAGASWSWGAVLLTLHISGMTFVAGWLALQWTRLQQRRMSAEEVSDQRIRRRFAIIRDKLGVRRFVQLLVASDDTVPCSFGLLRQVVIVPRSLISEPS